MTPIINNTTVSKPTIVEALAYAFEFETIGSNVKNETSYDGKPITATYTLFRKDDTYYSFVDRVEDNGFDAWTAIKDIYPVDPKAFESQLISRFNTMFKNTGWENHYKWMTDPEALMSRHWLGIVPTDINDGITICFMPKPSSRELLMIRAIAGIDPDSVVEFEAGKGKKAVTYIAWKQINKIPDAKWMTYKSDTFSLETAIEKIKSDKVYKLYDK